MAHATRHLMKGADCFTGSHLVSASSGYASRFGSLLTVLVCHGRGACHGYCFLVFLAEGCSDNVVHSQNNAAPRQEGHQW